MNTILFVAPVKLLTPGSLQAATLSRVVQDCDGAVISQSPGDNPLGHQ